MLLNFSFRNYRSFAEPAQFSMQRLKSAAGEAGGWLRPDVSAVAALYGPNASGKSNFLQALRFVSRLVRAGFRSSDAYSPIPGLEPFLLDEALAEGPTDFLVEFVARDVRFEYSFSLAADAVLEEELVAYYTQQPSRLFLRETDEAGEQSIRFGSALKGRKQQAWSVTPRNELFLSVAGGIGKVEGLRAPYLFLAYNVVGGAREVTFFTRKTTMGFDHLSAADFERVSNLAALADFGIEGIELRRDQQEDEPRGSDSELPEDTFSRRAARPRANTRLVFRHTGPNGTCELDPEHESEGTVSALRLFARALDVLANGQVLLVDELDRSLHPTLVKEFVALFADPEANPRQAQLIFTTHDVSLITASGDAGRVLERDQVWFCEKDSFGRSELVPATSYSPRKGENLGRNYLNGIYSALPRLMLREGVVESLASLKGRGDEKG